MQQLLSVPQYQRTSARIAVLGCLCYCRVMLEPRLAVPSRVELCALRTRLVCLCAVGPGPRTLAPLVRVVGFHAPGVLHTMPWVAAHKLHAMP
jgi:hypothetical protein